MSKLSIKINIAGRIYPMKIERDSEEYIRNAVKKIEGRLKFYEENYAIKDKQDMLAMCLIEYASKFESVISNAILFYIYYYLISKYKFNQKTASVRLVIYVFTMIKLKIAIQN